MAAAALRGPCTGDVAQASARLGGLLEEAGEAGEHHVDRVVVADAVGGRAPR